MPCLKSVSHDFKNYSKKTSPKITILDILVCKIQPEKIIKSRIFTCFNFITNILILDTYKDTDTDTDRRYLHSPSDYGRELSHS